MMAHNDRARQLLKGLTIVTVNGTNQVLSGDIAIMDGMIQAVGPSLPADPEDTVLDMEGMLAMPPFVQTHAHLCQTLWRNMADDMSLIQWLKERTLPLEAAMTASTVRSSVLLSAAELLLSGTLLVNDFGLAGLVPDIARAVSGTGLRAVTGRILMDLHDGPPQLRQDASASIADAIATQREITGLPDIVGCSINPRFAVSSSMRLLEMVREAAGQTRMAIHTHASENEQENELTVARFGARPIRLYEKLGMLGPALRLAHCVKVDNDEIELIARTGTKVMHCPSTNLKLGSGIAPIPRMLEAGIPVSIGADGAPANNNLDMFNEMRIASLIQKPEHGPDCMPAWQILRMATINGAAALGLQHETGSIEPGKRADILILNPHLAHSTPFDDPVPAIVYSMGRENVRHVLSKGVFVVRDGKCELFGIDSAIAMAQMGSRDLRRRSSIDFK
jgi:cytosine/adenosine deaminase-related metal-dependent hydrolase